MFRLRDAETGMFRFFSTSLKVDVRDSMKMPFFDLTVLRHVETAREKEGSSPYEVTMPFLDLSILDRGEREGERERERDRQRLERSHLLFLSFFPYEGGGGERAKKSSYPLFSFLLL